MGFLHLPTRVFAILFDIRDIAMFRIASSLCFAALALAWSMTSARAAETPKGYEAWKHSGSIWIDTTPTGADLPAEAVLKDFPLLVRLHGSWFDFMQARSDGADLRFFTAGGTAPLASRIETWDAAEGEAAVWVRVPEIKGAAQQELRVVWGNPNASASNAASTDKVFADSNGHKSVWHFDPGPKGDGAPYDDVGTLESKDVDTTPTPGVIGLARHFAGKQGVFGGDKIPNYPTDANQHSTEAWFRAEKPNTTLIAWGNEEGGRGSKVRMMLRSPPHIRIDSNFSDVWTTDRLKLGEWIHVAHTYSKNDGRLYINGKLAGEAKPTLNFESPAKLWLGGWYHNYDFVGDLDEVRISGVARSADWIRMEYENQKPLQTAVGMIVQPGDELAISPATAELEEFVLADFRARAAGARKLYWVEKRDGRETVIAVDRLTYDLPPERIAGDKQFVLQLCAVYPDGVRTKDAAIKIKETIPDPEFTISAPATWDGVTPLTIGWKLTNEDAIKASRAQVVNPNWKLSGPAVVGRVERDGYRLTRALGSGPLVVSLRLDNFGIAVERRATINIAALPENEPLVTRDMTVVAAELPADGQFYARNAKGFGRLIARGKLAEPAADVLFKLYRNENHLATESLKVGPENAYGFDWPLEAGLHRYRVEVIAVDAAGKERKLHEARDIVCGDAYLIIGQSNAVATDFGKDAENPPINEWVRTFGATAGDPKDSRLELWAPAQARNRGGISEIGYWGMELGRRLVEQHKMPICIINGAVGGTRIDQHQRNDADPTDAATIYGRLLWRVREAKLTHGIRGILWHQGENDQGADGPTGGFGWETYRQYFHSLAASWRKDYPNARHLYMFQIWPRSCSMGVRESDDMLREVQRELPGDFAHLGIMSTLGIKPPGGCHFPAAGYAEFARLMTPLVERDLYGRKFAESITPPNLLRAKYASAARDAIVLEFDQPVVWHGKLAGEFLVDREKGRVTSGRAEGSRLTLHLTPSKSAPSQPNAPSRIAYLDSKQWSQDRLLIGTNGIAALTFYDVAIED